MPGSPPFTPVVYRSRPCTCIGFGQVENTLFPPRPVPVGPENLQNLAQHTSAGVGKADREGDPRLRCKPTSLVPAAVSRRAPCSSVVVTLAIVTLAIGRSRGADKLRLRSRAWYFIPIA